MCNVKEFYVVNYAAIVDESGREHKYPVGTYLDRDTVVKRILSGDIVQVVFRKKEGIITSRNVVTKKGDQRSSFYICATDLIKKKKGLPSFININVVGILGIVADGQMHIVKEAVTSGKD